MQSTYEVVMESYIDHLHDLRLKALTLRIDILRILNKAGSGYLGGTLSCVEILTALYFGRLPARAVMQYDTSKPGSETQDYFVMSKAHATVALYTVLAEAGFFPKSELNHYRQVNSMLQSCPNKRVPGICMNAGTAGYGLSAAVGLAMAIKADKQSNRVFCLAGDGELQDGQFWEAVMVASQHKLDNLVLLLDWNGLQMDGVIRSIVDIEPVADKFQSFGWKTIPVIDGHNFEDLLLGFERAFEVQRRPAVMTCRTVKSKGVLFAENKPYYHADVLSNEELAEALPKLQEALCVMKDSAPGQEANFGGFG